MRCFILTCLLAVSAVADVAHLGYNYNQGSGIGSLGGGSSDLSGSSSGPSVLSIGGGSSGLGSLGGSGSLGSLGGLGGISSGSSGHSSHSRPSHRVIQEPAEVDFTKEFYTFDAPEESHQEEESVQRVKESLKKHLQVVFIKTPESRSVQHAALSLAKSASESNTAIYVLQKQPDVSSLTHELNLIHTHNAHKPEVHIVKYRTPEEAANAQRTIAQRYESLGGTSSHKHGGTPDVLNYASQAPASSNNHDSVSAPSGGLLGSGSTISAPSQNYLPVTFRF